MEITEWAIDGLFKDQHIGIVNGEADQSNSLDCLLLVSCLERDIDSFTVAYKVDVCLRMKVLAVMDGIQYIRYEESHRISSICLCEGAFGDIGILLYLRLELEVPLVVSENVEARIR